MGVGEGFDGGGIPTSVSTERTNKPDSFGEAPEACSSENGLSIVPQYGWKDKKKKE